MSESPKKLTKQQKNIIDTTNKTENITQPQKQIDNLNETTNTTQYKYNDFKKKYNTPRKKTGLPSFEYKRWNPQVIDKLVKNHGYDDDDYDNDSNDLY